MSKYIPLAVRLAALETENQWLRDVNWHLSKLVQEIGKTAELVTNERRLYGDPKYSYIPYDNEPFLRALISIRWKLYREGFGHPYSGKGTRPNFIDIGCGVGDKLILAKQLYCRAFGIEWNPYLIRYAKRVFGATDDLRRAAEKNFPYLANVDAVRHSYDNYHIIFLNPPYQDERMEVKLERRVYSQAALGTFLLMPSYISLPPKEDYAQGKNFGDSTLLVFRRLKKAGRKLVS